MRKFLLAAPLLLAAQLSYAQTPLKAGTVLVGGGVNYTHTSEDVKGTYAGSSSYSSSYSTNSLLLNPYAGIFVADNLALGVSMSYTTSNSTYSYSPSSAGSSTHNGNSQFRVGAFGQYYRMLTEHFGLTGTLSGGYEHDVQPAGATASYGLYAKGFYASLTPGIVFFPIPKLSVGASIGGLNYYRLAVKPDRPNVSSDYEDTVSSFGANFGLDQLTFSGTYYFGR